MGQMVIFIDNDPMSVERCNDMFSAISEHRAIVAIE